jgi:serine/threonine-protein kinase
MSEASSALDVATRSTTLDVGTRIGGYLIEGVLGEGAHGVVYAARAERDASAVALKVIHPHLTGDPQVSRRFAREASILGQLDGEHVARMLDFIDADGLLAIALERVEGRSLEAMLAERAPLEIEVAIEIALQICAALGAAHARGIVHRDLKTANVLVEAVGGARVARVHVKVVDFGLGKLLQGAPTTALTEHGMIFGSPEYMAPEQASGDDVDARADLYAAGVILYEMTVGTPPFSGRSAMLTMTAHLREPPRSPREARPDAGITPALEAVILRALAKSPGDRYASARELAQAIASARDEPRVIAPRGVHDAAALAVGDTDLHLPAFTQATTLRTDELAEAARAVVAIDAGAPTTSRGSAAAPETLPSPRAPAEPLAAKPRGATIGDEPTTPTGEAPASTSPGTSRGTHVAWAIVAIVAAAIGVAVGILAGAR